MLAVQYLEPSPEIARITPQAARDRLRAAFDRLPIGAVLLGWNLPDALVDACAAECLHRGGVALYRWQPLLTGDGKFTPLREWSVVSLNGDPIPGFRDMPEFTFVCPNRTDARAAILSHLSDLLRDNRYDGLFLDRIRYPSPAADPQRYLGCFCEDCQRLAAQDGLDRDTLRQNILHLLSTPDGALAFVHALLNPDVEPGADTEFLMSFLKFRRDSVTRLVLEATGLVREQSLWVGLDCFSPCIAPMVGQDLRAFDTMAGWIKTMSYGHTLGPAGIPFELLGLADWLVERKGIPEPRALSTLSDAAGLPLPYTRLVLRQAGLSPQALHQEVNAGRKAGISTLWAGIELVDVSGVTHLNTAQITADLHAFRDAGVDGLVLSWDLWHIPLERLDLVREAWV